MKRAVIPYDFNAFGQAIKAARMAKGESRKNVSDDMNISPRYLANIENKGQQPSLQIFYISGASGGLTSSAFRSGSKARCFQIRGRYTALCPRHFPNGQSRTQCPCGISLRSCLSYTPQVL